MLVIITPAPLEHARNTESTFMDTMNNLVVPVLILCVFQGPFIFSTNYIVCETRHRHRPSAASDDEELPVTQCTRAAFCRTPRRYFADATVEPGKLSTVDGKRIRDGRTSVGVMQLILFSKRTNKQISFTNHRNTSMILLFNILIREYVKIVNYYYRAR